MKTALLAGSTGLIGNQLLTLLLASSHYEKVIALVRREIPKHPKLEQLSVEFDNLAEQVGRLKVDDVFCCLGTTMAKAGSKEKFREVDFDYPHLLAKIAFSMGARQYLLVSSLGAAKESPILLQPGKGRNRRSYCRGRI